MIKYKIGISDYVKGPFDIEKSAFSEPVEFIELNLDKNKNNKLINNCDALLVWNAAIDKNIISMLDNCKILVRYGVGYDAIDLKQLEKASIPICNTPDYGTEEVADTAVSMILSFHRSILEYNYLCKEKDSSWIENTYKEMRRSNTRTVGIIGVGRIGTAVINRLKNFGFNIIGFDPYQPSGHEKAIGYKRVNELKELLNLSDIISIHTPMTNETKGMVDEDFFKNMKRKSIFINTARGSILKNLDCLYFALKNNYISGAGLDVLPEEPPKDHILIKEWKKSQEWIRGRLIINPHSSYYSMDAWEEMRFKAAETINLFLSKGIIRNQITKVKK